MKWWKATNFSSLTQPQTKKNGQGTGGGSSNGAVVLQHHQYFCYFYKKTFVKYLNKNFCTKTFIKNLKNYFFVFLFLCWFSLFVFYLNSIFDFSVATCGATF